MELKKCTKNVKDLRRVMPGYAGYYRMYFRNGWYGRWFDLSEAIIKNDMEKIVTIICEKWKNGCDDAMITDLEQYHAEVSEDGKRHLLEAEGDDYIFFILIDTTFGNHDYPIRIYTYKK